MFTGIITYVFPIRLDGKDLYIYPDDIGFYKLIKIGDSVCINGICLTVVQIYEDKVRFEVTEETLNRTNLLFDTHQMGNIELSVLANNRMGGHIVWGHVFQTGHVESIDFTSGDMWISFVLPEGESFQNLLKYKGSVAVNGVSLTVADVLPSETKFKICLIPHTIKVTTFNLLKRGDMVNLEFYSENNNIKEDIKTLLDDDYMMMALEEAEISIKTTPPNPWVGCVIVKDGEIIAKGHHEKAGKDHAEVMAIKNCMTPEKIAGSTLYCTLEPCCHLETACYPNQCFHKGNCPLGTRSLSCSDVIINNKVGRVVVGIVDPDTRVSGNGIKKLRDAGIIVDLISAESRTKIEESLKPYIYNRVNNLPYVTLKVALTIDNCYTCPDVKWITHLKSREVLYDIWERNGAIIIGGDTVQKDNPSLDATDYPTDSCKSVENNKESIQRYKKIVLDSSSLINLDAKIFKSCDTIVFTEKLEKWKNINGCHIKKCNPKNIREVLEVLNSLGIMSVLVEGGGKVHKSFLNSGLSNKLLIFRGSKFFGKDGIPWEIPKNNIELKYLSSQNMVHEGINNSLETYEILNKECNKGHTENVKVYFTPIEEAIKEFARGNMVVVMDDENRENEGDLIVAAQKITESQMVEIINNTTGIICTPLEKSRAMKLNLQQMVSGDFNTDPNKTAFTISVDHKNTGTGVSALDRLMTVRALADENSHPSHFRRPGHIFPLVSNSEGLGARRGHTEASIALCELGDIYPRVAVIGELKNSDGTMKRRDDCFTYAKTNNYPIITVQQIYEAENKFKLLAQCNLKTKFGDNWKFLCFNSGKNISPHKVLVYGDILTETGKIKEGVNELPLRIHSECFTGDVLKSLHCDCGEQLEESMKYIVEKGKGILIFPSEQEGRGIGILDKVKCYRIQQEEHLDTFSANLQVGHGEDSRCYDDISFILRKRLGIQTPILEILTNNPYKIKSLKDIIWRKISIHIESKPQNQKYLQDKDTYFQKGGRV